MSDKTVHEAVRELDIEWTSDCGGKKDYDGALIGVSTRYHPRGDRISLRHTRRVRCDDCQGG